MRNLASWASFAIVAWLIFRYAAHGNKGAKP